MTARRALGHLGLLAFAWVGLVLVALDGRGGPVTAFLALAIGGIGAAMASVITTTAVAFALREVDAGHGVHARDAFRAAFERLRALVGAAARQIALTLYYFDLEARRSVAAPSRHGRHAPE